MAASAEDKGPSHVRRALGLHPNHSFAGDLDIGRDVEAGTVASRDGVRALKIVANAPIGNPAPLGLFAFGLTTALLQGAVTTITEPQGTKNLTVSFAMFYGGLIQLLAGMWEMYKNNTFAATAFSSYGGFWMGFAIYNMLERAGIWTGESYGAAHANKLVQGDEMMLSLWGILTFIFFVQTLRINRALQTLFFSLALLFFLLAGGVRNALCNKVAGWLGIWTAAVAFYAATAILTAEIYDKEWLPLGHVKKTRAVTTAAPAPTATAADTVKAT